LAAGLILILDESIIYIALAWLSETICPILFAPDKAETFLDASAVII